MFNVDPKSLSDTRIQLHWAAQTLSAAADAMLEKTSDDSHSNLGWDSSSKTLGNRVGATIDVTAFALSYENQTLDLTGMTLNHAFSWLGERVGKDLRPRDYDMPAHQVANGAVFNPNQDHLVEIGNWYNFGAQALAGIGELRIWPHHFDIGFFLPNVSEEKSIGGGFTVGDDHYNQPYIYVNPYGIDKPNSLPNLGAGFWTDKWLGAVITSNEFGSDNGIEIATDFTTNAINICKGLFGGCGEGG